MKCTSNCCAFFAGASRLSAFAVLIAATGSMGAHLYEFYRGEPSEHSLSVAVCSLISAVTSLTLNKLSDQLWEIALLKQQSEQKRHIQRQLSQLSGSTRIRRVAVQSKA
jgi:hypothetical protein